MQVTTNHLQISTRTDTNNFQPKKRIVEKKNTKVDWSTITPGVYWAYEKDFEWNNLIVHVYGSSPFLKIRVWNFSGSNKGLKELDQEDIYGMQLIQEPDQI